MTTTVTVYLNDKTDFFNGFDAASAQLREAVRFDVDAPSTYVELDRVLSWVFEQLNINEPSAEWARRYREQRNRSLSLGDVVTVGETAWAVARLGWDQLTSDAVAAGLARHNGTAR